MKKYPSLPHRQRGVTLLVGLIMLVVLTLFVVSAINMSTTGLKIAGNMQARSEARAAVQHAIEKVVSSTTFLDNPQSIADTPESIDINNDGTNEYTVKFDAPKPACLGATAIKTSELDFSKESDRRCVGSNAGPTVSTFTSAGPSASTNSLCAKQLWDVRGYTTAADSGVSLALHQGVTVRVGIDVNCK